MSRPSAEPPPGPHGRPTPDSAGRGAGADPGGATASAGAASDDRALRLTVAAHADHVPTVRNAVRGFAEKHRVARPIDVALAVGEACANVVLHAYTGGPPGLLHVTGVVQDELVSITVADEGSGLTPRPDSPGLGLGLPIIARASDHFQVTERLPTGTLLTMDFARAVESEWRAYEQVRDDLAAALQEETGLDAVEARIERAPLSTEARDALWLAAWATVERRRGSRSRTRRGVP